MADHKKTSRTHSKIKNFKCTKIYREKVTGAHNDRRELLKMLNGLAPGDLRNLRPATMLSRSTISRLADVTIEA